MAIHSIPYLPKNLDLLVAAEHAHHLATEAIQAVIPTDDALALTVLNAKVELDNAGENLRSCARYAEVRPRGRDQICFIFARCCLARCRQALDLVGSHQSKLGIPVSVGSSDRVLVRWFA